MARSYRRKPVREKLLDSLHFFRSADLPSLTYPLIIKELRPEEPLAGAFHFPTPYPDLFPMGLVFAPSQIETWPIARLLPYAHNAKMHGGDQVTRITASMAGFNWTLPGGRQCWQPGRGPWWGTCGT